MKSTRRTALYSVLIALWLLLSTCGCGLEKKSTFTATQTSVPTVKSTPSVELKPTPSFDLADYAFPGTIDPQKRYLFYLHGKIIEDQGIPAVSPEYGEYQYGAILEKLMGYGFVVISEQRPKDTDSFVYANRIAGQVNKLLDAGVPENHILVVGASKGGGIAILVSSLLEDQNIYYVLMAICEPTTVEELKRNGVQLHGRVLSIFDESDKFAGSCQELFDFSEENGLASHEEIILHIGTGHGVLYQPLDEWVLPVVVWGQKP